ncbi:MAG: V-type ATP synthase subunit A, partial [Spirochaetaceae bacterium]|nr:V-type ATP synthase subunit A [Spirochaetaceae bacterium]
MIEGSVIRISGPIVRATGLGAAGLFDLVEVGGRRIIGEIVRIEGQDAVIQVYEDDTGLKIGAKVFSTGRPLSACLGPGLMGTIYDGIQRPLEFLYKTSGAFLDPGARGEPMDREKRWEFIPDADLVSALEREKAVPLAPGMVLGTVKETESVTCKIMVPPDIQGG